MRPKLGLLILAVVALVVGTATQVQADKKPEPAAPVGSVNIKITEVAFGMGVTWGKGTLRYKGKEYNFKVRGLNAIAMGVSSIEAKGEVYNLKKLDDFGGKYVGVSEGAAVFMGKGGLVVKNYNGVVLNLNASQTGMELKLGNEGLDIIPEWE